MLIHLTCNEFIEELASDSPAPGGGSVSALAGALGVALVSMVAKLTLGKEKFSDQEQEILETLNKAEELTKKLKEYVDLDTEAFNLVMDAFRLPKGNEEERKKRSAAIQELMQHAASLPLEVAEDCLTVLKLSKTVVEKGNPNALSDGGVAALMAHAGIQGAIYNVKINLASIYDESFKKKMAERENTLMEEAGTVHDEIKEILQKRLGIV